jgi:IS5 family transposase
MLGRADDQRELLDAESVAGHLLPAGSVFGFLAEHRGSLFPDEMFADLFASVRGRPSVPADVVATVIVLQTLHGLSDRDAADAVTFDLRWKAACGLPVTAAAFHPTTLTYWRRRLKASDRPNRIFDAVKAVIAETGVLAGKNRRALDSTILDDAVATQDTVTQLIAAIRRVRREVPGAAQVIAEACTAHDYDDPGKPMIAWDDESARAALVDALVRDALAVLAALESSDDPKAADALGLLALIAGQDVELVDDGDGSSQWRIVRRVAEDRIISVVDPEARHAHKTVHRRQDGFKAHVAVEPDTGLVTDCQLTKAAGAGNSDAAVGPTLLAGEPDPVEALADSAYGSGDARATLAEGGHRTVIKPIPLRPAVADGFTLDDFDIDTDARLVTCPAGQQRPIRASGTATFGALCRDCPLRPRCTTSRDGRSIVVNPHHRLLADARRQAFDDPDFAVTYRQHRPMVERSIAWLARGNRRLRYRGVANNDLWLHHRAAAVNLKRMITGFGLIRQDGAWTTA